MSTTREISTGSVWVSFWLVSIKDDYFTYRRCINAVIFQVNETDVGESIVQLFGNSSNSRFVGFARIINA